MAAYGTWGGKYKIPKSVGEMSEPTLRSFAATMDDRGFDTFLVMKDLCVPISGLWWDDQYEVCRDPERYQGGDWCCADILSIRKDSLIRQAFLDECNKSSPTMQWHKQK